MRAGDCHCGSTGTRCSDPVRRGRWAVGSGQGAAREGAKSTLRRPQFEMCRRWVIVDHGGHARSPTRTRRALRRGTLHAQSWRPGIRAHRRRRRIAADFLGTFRNRPPSQDDDARRAPAATRAGAGLVAAINPRRLGRTRLQGTEWYHRSADGSRDALHLATGPPALRLVSALGRGVSGRNVAHVALGESVCSSAKD